MSLASTENILSLDNDRLPPSSSVFLALASLPPPSLPPSPILTSPEMCSAWSLSDIPILIFDNSSTSDRTNRNRPSPVSKPSPCLESIDSVCTFGPTSETDSEIAELVPRRGGNVAVDCCRTVESISSLSSVSMNGKHAIREDTMSADSELYQDDSSRRSNQCCDAPAHIPPGSSTQILCGILHSPSEIPAHSLPDTSFAEHATEFVNKTGLCVSHIACEEECPPHRTVPLSETTATFNTFKLPPKPADANTKQSQWLASRGSNDIGLASSRRRQDHEFMWLDGLSVDLLIDQEGFRSVQPSFKYSGIFHNHVCPKDTDSLVVEFKPITRQIYHFHYAPFDGLPLLRRVMINGESNRDFVSRQARLSLKSNGVYSIHGVEMSSLPTSVLDFDGSNHEEFEPIKLRWQFDYVVDDRIDVSGRFIDGEKTLTPLTFSCSPWLLHPSKGKKIDVMHVFKKSVAPKLVAEKLQPPAFAEPVPPSHEDAPHHVSAWSFHRRAQSNGIQRQLSIDPITLQIGILTAAAAKQNLGPVVNVSNWSLSHRRASSVGEPHATTSPPALHVKFAPRGDLAEHSDHICPRSRFFELILPKCKPSASSHSVGMPLKEYPGFVPLTPRPRHR
jgi:hypothetical protein